MSKTRSAKGEIVDFDRLKIKQQLSGQPVTLDVKAREDFIDKKLRRRNRRIKQATVVNVPEVVDSEALLNVETPPASEHIDPPKDDKKPVETKQKHRPPSK